MNERRVGELTIGWDCGDLPVDVIEAALPLELPLTATPARPPDLFVRARLVRDPIPSPASSGATPVLFHTGTRCFLDASGFLVFDGASLLRVQRGGAAIEAEVHDSSLARAQYFASVTMMMALALSLREHGYFHVHACAAAWPDGERWLLPAESNAGKSTLGLALFSAGARWLTDDALFLHRVGDQVEAVGWPRPMRMTHATAAAFPALAGLATPCPPGSARDLEVDPRLAFPDRGVHALRGPFRLLFPRIAHAADSGVVALDRAEAFGRLLHACAWVASEHLPRREEQLELLGRVVDGAHACELAVGTGVLRDPTTEVTAIRALLARR